MNDPKPTNGGLDSGIDMPDERKDAAACAKALSRNEAGMNEQVRLGAKSKDCCYLK